MKVEKSTITLFNSGNTLYVGGSGPGNYSMIQDAVNDSEFGGTVFVFDDLSPYYENIQINKSINLIGEDRNTTIIDANRSGPAIFIASDLVNIYEFTIQNSNKGAIEIDAGFGFCTITNNIITNNENGIESWCCTCNNTIEGNTFFNNAALGIDFYRNSNNNTISGNIFDHLPGSYNWINIGIGDSTGNIISYNMFKDGDCGINLWNSANYNLILNNTIRSQYEYGIEISESSYNKIIGNNISYNGYHGILIKNADSKNNIIYHNNLVYNYENAMDEGDNIWDDGEHGNYWSDYKEKYPNSKKLLSKGIWDTPYEIKSEYTIQEDVNKDTCPLIKPWPKSLSKTTLRDSPFIFNFNLLNWFLEQFLRLCSLFYLINER